ncbi:MAG: sulfite exporter TauE/SafE family protein [Saprospiraceae bacterium]|nr:sulfite exporter TauE/SafE family protein [Saprospiraceae bacterium]MDW8228608.1 sulfite exporter TauE/SafE family protein [Saprospiraceae bacterium]
MENLWHIDLTLLQWVLLALGGVVSGIINTLAGSGSLITLPILVFLCGLPAPIANGTNRIGVLLQNVVAIRALSHVGIADFQGSAWLVVPATIGGIVGSRIAVSITETWMNYTLGGLMAFMLIVLLLRPERWLRDSKPAIEHHQHPLTVSAFFFIGVYGGFIQAGVGIFLLAGLVWLTRYSLSGGNGVKLLIVLMLTIPSTVVFFFYNQVHLGYGLLMALFQGVGAWIGVRFIAHVPNANLWIYRLLLAITAVSALKFFL